MATIGEKIKDLRKKQGLTQARLAEILHVGKTTVSKWESGKNLPQLMELKNMSSLFQVSSDYLLGLSGRPSPQCEEEQKCAVLMDYFYQLESAERMQSALDFVISQFSEQENMKLEAEQLQKILDAQGEEAKESKPEVNIIVDKGLELQELEK